MPLTKGYRPAQDALEEQRRRERERAEVLAAASLYVAPAGAPIGSPGFAVYVGDMFRIAHQWERQDEEERQAGLRKLSKGWPGLRTTRWR